MSFVLTKNVYFDLVWDIMVIIYGKTGSLSKTAPPYKPLNIPHSLDFHYLEGTLGYLLT